MTRPGGTLDADAAATLPWIDEHAIEVRASIDDAWRSLVMALPRAFDGGPARLVARSLGCDDVGPAEAGALEEGTRFAGFRVVRARAPHELVVAGRHRFSHYAIVWRLEVLDPGRTRLSATTRAAFPGVPGALYRMLVIGSRGHVLVMRRLLGAIRDVAERPTGA